MPTIERSGASIYYEVTGRGEPIVLGHSLLCDGRMWQDVVPGLVDDYRLINVDFRGHRHSSAPGPFRLQDLADDWLAILDAEGIDQAVLCGLSMGGMTAMRLALAAPERVRALALLDSSAAPETTPNRIQYRIMAEIYRRFGLIGLLQRPVLQLMFGTRTLEERRDRVDRFVEWVEDHDRDELYRAIGAVFRRRTIVDRLPEIRQPTLVLVGAEDRATPPRYSEQMHAGLPDSRLEHIPGAGHLTAVEQPEAVTQALRDFLTSLP